jgi:hypothetical protein
VTQKHLGEILEYLQLGGIFIAPIYVGVPKGELVGYYIISPEQHDILKITANENQINEATLFTASPFIKLQYKQISLAQIFRKYLHLWKKEKDTKIDENEKKNCIQMITEFAHNSDQKMTITELNKMAPITHLKESAYQESHFKLFDFQTTRLDLFCFGNGDFKIQFINGLITIDETKKAVIHDTHSIIGNRYYCALRHANQKIMNYNIIDSLTICFARKRFMSDEELQDSENYIFFVKIPTRTLKGNVNINPNNMTSQNLYFNVDLNNFSNTFCCDKLGDSNDLKIFFLKSDSEQLRKQCKEVTEFHINCSQRPKLSKETLLLMEQEFEKVQKKEYESMVTPKRQRVKDKREKYDNNIKKFKKEGNKKNNNHNDNDKNENEDEDEDDEEIS